jgi:serine/threonine protein phosphatase PrpC
VTDATIISGRALPAIALRSTARTHVGLVRSHNEDRVLDRPEMVADGMGGASGGEIASGRIVEALQALNGLDSAHAWLNGVCAAIQAVNHVLVAQAAISGEQMGSTVVSLLIQQGHFACVWAGDSRAYRLRNAALEPLTHDHSLVQALVDAGTLTAEEARGHRQAHVITRAVGDIEALTLDVSNGDVVRGDVFLLCSDGLTGLVRDEEIAAALMTRDLDSAADELLTLALARGGRDNISLVLVAADLPGR